MALHPLIGVRVSPVVLPAPGDYSLVGQVVLVMASDEDRRADSCVVAWNNGTLDSYALTDLIGYDDPETWNHYAKGGG